MSCKIDMFYATNCFLKSIVNTDTKRTYRAQLGKFIAYCAKVSPCPTLALLNPSFVGEWQSYQFAQGSAPATIALNIKVLKRFDKWLATQMAWRLQLESLKVPTIPEASFAAESEELRQQIIKDCLRKKSGFVDATLAALAYCYSGLGLRRVEPLRILTSQLNLKDGVIEAVRMKHSVIRSKVIPAAHLSIFADYASWREFETRKRRTTSKILLVHGPRLEPFSSSTAVRWIIALGTRPHALRHAYARALLQHTKNIRLVAYELGHRCLTTTMGYTRNTEAERRWAHETLYQENQKNENFTTNLRTSFGD